MMNHSEHHNHDHSSDKGGHGHHHGMFKQRFWISLIATIPVLALSPTIQTWLGVDWAPDWGVYALLFLSSFIFFYGGWPFLQGLYREVSKGKPGMMTLIAVATSVAWAYSAAVALGLPGKTFFWELVTLVDIMLLGHWIEMRVVSNASQALEKLAEFLPSEAHLLNSEGEIEEISLEKLKKGDKVLIRANEKIPADGKIIEGESYVDEHMVSGESVPVKKQVGDELIGGTLNGRSSLKMEVTGTGEESYLTRVYNMVRDAQQAKSKTQHLADRAAKWLTIISLSVGFITLGAWLSFGFEFVQALERMVTVMVVTCPHALGLAIPLVVAISTAESAKNGLLIQNRTAFENARKIDAIVFDKTGTLTKGDFGVRQVEALSDEVFREDVLTLAASLEQSSEHPIGEGIVRIAKGEELDLREVEGFEAMTGQGIRGTIDGTNYAVVSPGYLETQGIEIPIFEDRKGGDTIVYLLRENTLIGRLVLSDELRPESKEAVQHLHDNGMKVFMATGDNEETARAISEELSLDGYYSEVLPDQKVDIVKELQEEGRFVAMTGDGVNDAPALATADIGIAVGSGTDVAAETADIILTRSNPRDITALIDFGRSTYSKMIQNLFWATGYNVITIPLAAGVLYPVFMLSPAVGAVIMSLSTIIVALNAMTLKRSLKRTLN